MPCQTTQSHVPPGGRTEITMKLSSSCHNSIKYSLGIHFVVSLAPFSHNYELPLHYTWLQITVGHRTTSAQNTFLCGQTSCLTRHNQCPGKRCCCPIWEMKNSLANLALYQAHESVLFLVLKARFFFNQKACSRY